MRSFYGVLRFVCVLLTLCVVAGCSTTKIVQEMTTPPEHEAQNQPIRKLRALVLWDNKEYIPRMEQTLRESSEILRKQVGIELAVTISPTPIVWEHRGRGEMIDQLYRDTVLLQKDFDIAVGFTELTFTENVACLLGCWLGVTDDSYRRFIVMREFGTFFLTHEFGHTMILDHVHSEAGLMKAMVLPIVPHVYLLGKGDYSFTQSDRVEVLKNKWRTYGEKVKVPEAEDCIGQCDN